MKFGERNFLSKAEKYKRITSTKISVPINFSFNMTFFTFNSLLLTLSQQSVLQAETLIRNQLKSSKCVCDYRPRARFAEVPVHSHRVTDF